MTEFKFVELSNRELSAQIRAEEQTQDRIETRRWNILGNCIHRAIVHKDVTWVNKGRAMASGYKSGMVNEYLYLAKTLVPYKFTPADGFHGKMIKRKYEKWADTWQEELEKYVNALGEKHIAKNDKAREYDMEKDARNTAGRIFKNEADLNAFIKLLRVEHGKKAAKTIMDPENQERIKKNEAEHAEAVKVEEARRKAA